MSDISGKERFHLIMEHKSDRCGFWHGCPNPDGREELFKHFGVRDDFELGVKLGSTCRWVMPEDFGYWTNANTPMWDVLGGQGRTSLSQKGVFADTEDVDEVHEFNWPKVEYIDFTKTLKEIDRTVDQGQAVLSGSWSHFFHLAADFFGMEEYFIKMHTHPEVVDAVTKHIVDFFLEINEILFSEAGNKIDSFFFGNDFGSQLDLLISPESFNRFVMPYFKKFTEQAHAHSYYVLLHSCGSIDRVIPTIIDAGVNAIHPIQAKAANMSAEHLSSQYNDKVVFVGGVDAQGILPFGSTEEVQSDVRRLKKLFGTNFIVSPSHESLLPNIPYENIETMAKTALEQ